MVYKYFVVHDVAVPPGLAACAASRQGQFAKMEKLIWEKGFAERDLSPEKMTALAKEAGLDLARYEADVKSPGCQQWLQQSQEELSRVGAGGTPAFFVNGRFLGGAQPFGAFKQVIDEELKKFDAAGIPVEQYYQKVVVEGGVKSLE